MRFQQAVAEYPSLKTIYSQMELQTSMGRKLLTDTEFSHSSAWIKRQWEQTEECMAFRKAQNEQSLHHFLCLMGEICDISGTISLIEQGETADDVGLFELKVFCINVKKVGKLFASSLMPLPDLQEVINILDPEKLELPRFYIYSAYSKELEEKRKEWEKAKEKNDQEASRKLYCECLDLEDKVREELCCRIRPLIAEIKQAMESIAQTDVAFAKAVLAEELHLNKVSIDETAEIKYRNMFHPVVKRLMTKSGRRYQDIDVQVDERVLLITGANMAGKTMILKTLALNQLLLQYGFFLACESGEVCLVESVQCSIGDGQNEEQGLSSFAWEIKTLDNIIKTMRQGGRHLVLVDELARTTNPIEGKKLVEGFIKVCSEQSSLAVVTTHYSNIQAPCRSRRLKVLMHKPLPPPIDIDRISDHIDYSLIESDNRQVPTEALNLCRLLAVDDDWIRYSEG
mgnify:FL=1